MLPRTRTAAPWALAVAVLGAACSDRVSDDLLADPGYSFYALVETIDGTSFGPPLGPTIEPAGAFDPTLLDRLQVVLEATDGAAHTTTLATFSAQSTPGLKLLAAHELYWMNVPAAVYFTDPAQTYRFRALLDGREIGRSDMSSRIFEVLRYVPALPVGVKLRIEPRPAPALAGITPATLVAGSSDFTLTVTGSGFVHDSIVRFAGQDLATTWISSAELQAHVPATAIATSGAAAVLVSTPAPGGGTSSAASFVAANPRPTLTAVSPASAVLGAPALTLTLTGASFVSGAHATFAGLPLASTFVSDDSLTATLPAALLTAAGLQPVTVVNPDPGGASAALDFTVMNVAPSISSLSPATVPAGSAALTLTVDGASFVGGAVVAFDGAPLATTFVSAARLTATLPASALATCGGTHTVSATNPAPAAGSSAGLTFTIACATCADGVRNGDEAGVDCGGSCGQCTDGATASTAAIDCATILASGHSSGSGLYWIDPDGGSTANAFRAYCDMTTDGGGWTLVLQASSSSAYTYSHAIWTNTSAPTANTTNPALDQDIVSSGFYALTAGESMLCMGDLSHCASWTHRVATPRDLSNGSRADALQSDSAFCTTLQCGRNTMPNAFRNATPGSSASAWHRFGYVNDVNAWGTSTRIGATADNDASDSSDTIIGIGLTCASTCRTDSVTGAPHDAGSGYYKYNGWSTAPHDGALRSFLFIRKRASSTLNTQDAARASCSAILDAGLSHGNGLYWIDPDGGSTANAFRAYCDMTTDGGGWTLVLQSSSSSAYTYSHAVWTNTSAPAANTTDGALDQDVASPGFYSMPASESMLCMGDRGHCAAWDHATDTARNLANGARMSSYDTAWGTCSILRCGADTLPTALRDATPGTTVAHWHRFGYVNDVNASFGSSTRVGFTGDIDTSDSSDTIIGMGLTCAGSCRSYSATGAPHDTGSGYYKYYSSSTPLNDGALAGWLFIRNRTRPALNAQADALEDCEAIRAAGRSSGSGVYWIAPAASATPVRAYCDMTTDGGGWTLVLQTTASSPYVYSHPVWTNTSAPSTNTTDPALDQDLASPAFYAGTFTESMLCMGDLAHCASWAHRSATPRDLANGPRAEAQQSDSGFCSTFRCGTNTMPNAIRNATPGTTASAWHRFGYVNDVNGWGTSTRIGVTADNDSSDSSDTIIGVGIDCAGLCSSYDLTGPAHATGSGYYKYNGWSTAPHDGALRSFLFSRKRRSLTLNTQGAALPSCSAILAVGASRGSGVYWIDPDGGAADNAVRAYCDMTTDGGGWTLVLQASSSSAYTYGHAVWTNTSAPLANVTDAAVDQDMVSMAFHTLTGRESMLCMGATPRCASWDHALNTARNLANGTRLASTQGAGTFCSTFKCGATTMPTAIRDATPGTTAGAWHRWGYVNDVNSWGTSTRVGATADNDASDSSDTVIGLGLQCASSCRSYSVTGAPHDTGSGFYKYNSWSTPLHDGPLSGALFIR